MTISLTPILIHMKKINVLVIIVVYLLKQLNITSYKITSITINAGRKIPII